MKVISTIDIHNLSGIPIGLKVAAIVGGVKSKSQSILLKQKPHIVIATPGRLVHHLEKTKNFNLNSVKYLVRTFFVS